MVKLDHLGWVVEGTFKFGGSRVGVRTTSARVGAWLDEVLAEHRMTRWMDAFYSLVVAEEEEEAGRRNLHVLYKGTVPVCRTADLGTLARAFLDEIESHTFRGRRDAVFLDASLISGDGGITLIPSSFTPALAPQSRRAERLGLRLPATTWVAIDPATGHAVPAAKRLRIPEDAVERLAGPGWEARTDRFFLDAPASVDAVCLVSDQPVAPLAPVSRSSVLYRFAAMSQNLPAVGGRRTLEALGRLVSTAACFGIAPMGASQVLEAMAELTALGGGVRALT
jgi:hypothetical protein